MKTVVNAETYEIRRVSNEAAVAMVCEGWAYCGKCLWKKQVRDFKPEPESEVAPVRKLRKPRKKALEAQEA